MNCKIWREYILTQYVVAEDLRILEQFVRGLLDRLKLACVFVELGIVRLCTPNKVRA